MASSTAARTEHDRAQRRDHALRRAVVGGIRSRVLVAGFGVLTAAVTVRALGEARYGALAAFTTFTGLLGFTDFGLGHALMTRLARADARGEGETSRALVST